MSLRALLATALIVLVPVVLAPAAMAADIGPFGMPTAPYSADSRVTADGQTMTARIHADGPRERREIRDGDVAQVMLLDHATKKATMLVAEQKVAMEVEMDPADGGGAGPGLKWTTEPLGSETIGQIQVTRHRIDGKGSDGAHIAGLVWLTAEKIPVKSDLQVTEDGQTVRVVQELTNLKIGPVDPALFTVPAGYQRVQMPAGAPGAPTPRRS